MQIEESQPDPFNIRITVYKSTMGQPYIYFSILSFPRRRKSIPAKVSMDAGSGWLVAIRILIRCRITSGMTAV